MKKQAYKRIGCVIFMTLMLMLLSFFPQSGQEHTSFAEAQPEEEVADLNIQKLELKDLSQERRIFISSPDEVVGFSANEFVIDVRTPGRSFRLRGCGCGQRGALQVSWRCG